MDALSDATRLDVKIILRSIASGERIAFGTIVVERSSSNDYLAIDVSFRPSCLNERNPILVTSTRRKAVVRPSAITVNTILSALRGSRSQFDNFIAISRSGSEYLNGEDNISHVLRKFYDERA